jgi:hypothetical protein
MDRETKFYLWNRCFNLASKAIPWVAIVFVAIQTRIALQALAGKRTIADFIVGWFGDGSGLTITLSFSATAIATLWAIIERKLRHRKVEYLGKRNTKNEQLIDPNRTSSGLLPDGTTHPRDK